MLATALSLTVLPVLCLASPSIQVYVYPPLSLSAQAVVHAEAKALLAYHLRLESFVPSASSKHNGTVLGGSQAFVGKSSGDSFILSVGSSDPDDVIPDPLSLSFSFPTPHTSAESLLEQYSRVACRKYDTILNEPYGKSLGPPLHGSDHSLLRDSSRILDISSLLPSLSSDSDSGEMFLATLAALLAFVERNDQEGDRFAAFDLTVLSELEKEWGRYSGAYQTAAASLKAVIQSAASKQSLSFAVILAPSSSSKLHSRQPPQSPLPSHPPVIPPSAPIFSTSTCFTTLSTCRNATSSCSSRGQCVGVTRAGRTCFVCECRKAPLVEGGRNVSWAGSMCQKQDLSQHFSLIAGTVIFLTFISLGSVTLLYGVGDQELPGTLTGGVGGSSKHE